MDDQPKAQDGELREINFGKGRVARLAIAAADANAPDVVSKLALLKPQRVVLIIGGADELDNTLRPQLEQLFSRGVARAAVDVQATIIDGGTQSGVMSLMGEAVADRGNLTPLIGVAPAPKVTYPGGPAEALEGRAALEANHSHFVLVPEPEWGDEVPLMYALAQELSDSLPVVAILVNGGAIAKEEALRAVRHQWPIIVIEGSGRLADEVATAVTAVKKKQSSVTDPDLAEIIAEGDIHIFSKKGSPPELRRLVVQQLSGNVALRLAWERFAKYDENAGRQQKSFSTLLWCTVWLGVSATVLAVLQKQLKAIPTPVDWQTARTLVGKLLYYLILIVPISISILVAATNRFKTGKKWVLLRGSAEAIKREIFHYRTRTGKYSDEEIAKASTSPEILLSQVVGNIARRISQTEVNELALKRYDGSLPPPYAAAETDDGMSFLEPDAYIAGRLDDQRSYFESKTIDLEKQLRWRQWLIYIIGGVGTLLAAINWQIWIAVTTALATALAAHLEHFQIEATLVKYNQSASDLLTVKSWWQSLSKTDQAKPANRQLLVQSTEQILENELTGWVQRMQDAMEKVNAAKEAAETDDDDQSSDVDHPGPKDKKPKENKPASPVPGTAPLEPPAPPQPGTAPPEPPTPPVPRKD
jgi:SLOG in TRPM, prokaryote/SMODS and SLOG-associating 2TM effector domain 1/Protein of unknown function (DUF4231)